MSGTTTKTVSADGKTFSKTVEQNQKTFLHPKTCSAGFSAQLTTRTSAIIGVLTTTGVNTIADGDRVALKWEVNGVLYVLYNCLVSGKSGNSFTITAPNATGFGTDLPALNTNNIIVNKAVVFDGYVVSGGTTSVFCVNTNTNGYLLGIFAPLSATATAMTDASPDNRLVVRGNGPLIVDGFNEVQSINSGYTSDIVDTLWLYNLSLSAINAEMVLINSGT